MDRIDACRKQYHTLFGGEPNQGEGSDPELLQILQRFIFGEVSQTGSLTEQQRELITCVVLAALQTLPQLKAHAAAALNTGVTPLQLREAVYGCMPYIGCPKTLNATAAVNEVFTAKHIALPLEPAGTVSEEDRLEKGKAAQMPLYGDEIVQALADLPEEYARKLPEFLSAYGFGDFHTRRGLDEKTRSRLEFAVLIALGGCDTQLLPHALGCLRSGSSRDDVYAIILQVLPYAGFPRALNAVYAVKGKLPETAEPLKEARK